MSWLDTEYNKIKKSNSNRSGSWLDDEYNRVFKKDKSPVSTDSEGKAIEPKRNRFTQAEIDELNRKNKPAEKPLYKRIFKGLDPMTPEQYAEQMRKNNEERAKTKAGAFGLGLVDSSTFGLSEKMAKATGSDMNMDVAKKEHPIAYTAGQIAGYVGPGEGANIIAKPLIKAATKRVASGIARTAIEGAITGGTMAAGEGIARSDNPKDFAKRVAIDTATGGALGAGANLAGKGIKKAAQFISDSKIKLEHRLATGDLKEPGVPKQFEGTADQMGIVAPGFRNKSTQEAFAFERPELEKTYQENKGIKQPTFLQKIKQGINDTFIKSFTRPISTLPVNGENAELYKELTRLPKIKSITGDDTVRVLDDITKDLDKNTFDLFSRKVLLDDLAQDVKNGSKLPNGFTPEDVAKELDRVNQQMPLSVQQAISKRKLYWDSVKNDYINSMKNIGVDVKDKFTREDYFHHQVLDHMEENSIKGTGNKLGAPGERGFGKARSGEYTGNINTDYLQAEYEVMAQMKHDSEVAKTIKRIKDNYDIADTVKADAKAQGLENWHEAIPEGYTTWQPKEGNVFYFSKPAGQEVVEQALKLRGVELNKIKDPKMKVIFEDIMNDLGDPEALLTMGGKRKEYVVKQEVADTLNNLIKNAPTNKFAQVAQKVQSTWKRWVLTGNPRSVIKYNIRNFTGDLDPILAGNPSTVKKIPKATKELYNAFKSGTFTPELKSWYDRGGFQELLYAQEIGDVNKLKPFDRFKDKTVMDTIKAPFKAYGKVTTTGTNFREAVNRYAAYLDYLDQMKNGKLKNYGASKKEIIEGLKSPEDKAFKLSNDLLGAYDEISEAGQLIRRQIIPFYSWLEVNFKRYMQLIKNVGNEKGIGAAAGLAGGKLAAKVGIGTAKSLIGMFFLTGAMAAWNQLKYPELEETLSEDVKSRPHIVLGKDKNGNTIYFSRLGALNDFLDWFGIGNGIQDAKDILNGKKTISEQLKSMALSPLNKVAGGVRPEIKTTAELATGQKLFPDVTKPRPIRDRAQYAAQSLGVGKEYDTLTGKPHRPYFNSLQEAVVYKTDPQESAFYKILDEKDKFIKKVKGEQGSGFFQSPKSNALYNYKLALKYGDKEAAKKYIGEYKKLGGNKKGLKASLAAMNPLYGLKDNEKKAFINSLSTQDRERLKLAMQYYKDVVTGKSN